MARSTACLRAGQYGSLLSVARKVERGSLPQGPEIWICGDCHVGNFGPVGNARGKIQIQIRDFDQTVIGNPPHDLIRLSLSLASAAGGSDLPGLTTVRMVERIMEDYHGAFAHGFDESRDIEEPEPVRRVAKKAATASWKSLAAEDLEGTSPTLPIGKCFWPLSQWERRDIERLVADREMHRLATRLRSRDDNEEVKLVDAAYWAKGCSSLGRSLRRRHGRRLDQAADRSSQAVLVAAIETADLGEVNCLLMRSP
jgi:uncharacterized protein (DUF2252 family)